MPMNEEMKEIKNVSLPFPLKHVGTCSRSAERAEYSIRTAIEVPMINRTANDWRFHVALTIHEVVHADGYRYYVAVKLQHDKILARMDGMEHVGVDYLPIFRLADQKTDSSNPSTVWVDDKCLESLALMESEHVKMRRLKIRNGRCKIMPLMQYVRDFISEQTGQKIALIEGKVKEYIESLTGKTYHVYAVDNLDEMSTADFGTVVRMIYGLHTRTNTSSCMVKGDPETTGADYYYGFLHPFHCYRTSAWTLLLVSDKTPEQIEQVDFADSDTKSPFLARAWATTCGTGLYYTWKFYGADNALQAINSDKEIVLLHSSPTNEELRLYKDTSGNYICAYIDGHNYVGVDSYAEYKDKDGYEYIIGYACEEHNDFETTYEPQHTTGLTEQCSKYVYCEIYEEDYPEDACVFSQQIGGYVHSNFWDFNNDCLDGYAIYRHYN